MLDFPNMPCIRCGERIGNQLFTRMADYQPEHLQCHQRARREAASTEAALPERRAHSIANAYSTEEVIHMAKKPTCVAYSAVEQDGGRTRWREIGAAFENRDASLTVLVDAVPLSGRIILLPPKKEREEPAAQS